MVDHISIKLISCGLVVLMKKTRQYHNDMTHD